MTYRITQTEQEGQLVLRLEGSFCGEGGRKLEEICDDAQPRYGNNILIDVQGVTYLDECSSQVFCRLKNQRGITLVGCNLFTKKVIDQSEGK